MFIIDFHTHCFPDTLAQRAIRSLSEKAAIPFFHDGTAAGLDALERGEGCDGYVVMSIATNPHQTAAVNRFAAQTQDISRHIYAFGSIHPENTDYEQQVQTLVSLGLRGVKLHPEYQNFHVNDKRVFPLYAAIFAAGLPLLFHAGEDEGFSAPWHAQPHKIAQVALAFPQGIIIAAHMGGYRMWEEAARELAPLPNVYMDISFCAGRMPQQDFEAACACWRSERILFGSDSPWHRPQDAIQAVNDLPCSQAQKEQIFAGNTQDILNFSLQK